MNLLENAILFEKILFSFLFKKKDIRDIIFPYMGEEIFDTDDKTRDCFRNLCRFIDKHEKFPSVNEFDLFVSNYSCYEKWKEILHFDTSDYETEFALGSIEEFVKSKKLILLNQKLAECTANGELGKLSEIQEELLEVQQFTFDSKVGLDLLEDVDRIYEGLTSLTKAIPTGIQDFDEAMEGGYQEKTITGLISAVTNGGKTMIMCSSAASIIMLGKNVLYITFEDSEEKIASRILQNLLDKTKTELKTLSREVFNALHGNIKNQIKARLQIKEFPEGGANAARIDALLKELKDKKRFIPDVVFVDYVGCMVPNGKMSSQLAGDDYKCLKRVVSEVRGIAMRTKIPFVSGLQSNRDGISSKTHGLDDIAESYGMAMKFDQLWNFWQSDDERNLGIMNFRFSKSRVGNVGRCFQLQFDIEKQRVTSCKRIADKPDNEFYAEAPNREKKLEFPHNIEPVLTKLPNKPIEMPSQDPTIKARIETAKNNIGADAFGIKI